MIKHTPATPLPWKIRGDHESIELVGADGDCINSAAKASYGDDYKRVAKDMKYELHAGNTYPKLVQVVSDLLLSFSSSPNGIIEERQWCSGDHKRRDKALKDAAELMKKIGEWS